MKASSTKIPKSLLGGAPQEVMRALHTHLGSSAAREASAALEVLLQLSRRQSAALSACHESLGTVLGYVGKYSDSQLQAVGRCWRSALRVLAQNL